MEELNFEKLFKLLMVSMKLNQCHPDTKLDIYWVLKNMLTIGPYTIYFLVLFNSIKYYLLSGDYFSAFNNGVPFTYYISMMFYYSLLIVNRPKVGNLIKCVKEDYTTANHMDIRRRKVIIAYALKGKNIMRFWFYLVHVSLAMFVLKSIFLTFYHTYKNGEIKLMPFHELHYPWNLMEYRENNAIVFVGLYFGEYYFTAMCVLIYISTVPLGPIFMLHACAQIELIKIEFENIFEHENIDENLNKITAKLQYIYSFVSEINECYTLIYEVVLKQTIVLLPFTSYALIQSIKYGKFTVEYVGVLIQGLISSSLPCYYGDLLMQKGEELQQAAYNCGWERVYASSARKTLLIIMTRAMHPVAIQTIFSIISLDTLTNVYRQAYTIFNLMSAM